MGNHDGLALDPERFADRPETHRLATIIRDETDAARQRPLVNSLRLLGMSETEVAQLTAEAALAPWYVILKLPAVIMRCAERAALSRGALVEFVITEITPPNWEALFWMSEWLKLIEKNDRAEEIEAEVMKAQAALTAKLTLWGRLGGQAKHRLLEEQKQWVRDEWTRHGRSEYGGVKAAFARVYVKLSLEKFGRQVTEQTIINSWLAGMPPP